MKYIFLVLFGLLIFACSDNTENQEESYEDLPEGKWNGEYMEVESEDDEDQKRPTKKSNGSEVLNLGKVIYSIGEKEDEITLFDKRKNDITINKNQIVIRIKDANERYFLIGIHKNEIYKNPEGKYVSAGNKKTDDDPMFTITYMPDLKDMLNAYQLKDGMLEVKKMNLKSGEVLLSAKGELMTIKDIKEGTSSPFEIEVKMNFETVVSAFNPAN
jgi:lipopolysaccharide export LptBFGC system permease protein LptF